MPFGVPVSQGGATEIRESGVSIGSQSAVNFIEGANITITPVNDPVSGEVDITIAATGGGSLDVRDEGVSQGGASSMDFVGSQVTATVVGANSTVTIAHGNQAGGTLHDVATGATAGFMSASDKTKLDGIATGATKGVTTQEEGVNAGTEQTTLNFVGAAITAASVGSTTTITVSTASPRTVTARTADLTLTSSNTNTTYTNRGAIGEVILTLPAASNGVYFRGTIIAAQYLRFTAVGGAVIYAGQRVSAANGYIRSNVTGSTLEIESDGTDWYINGPTGAWNVDE